MIPGSPLSYFSTWDSATFFTIRTAGEVVDAAVLASLEFAVEALDVEVLVVLGHESCGAVKAAAAVALDGAEVPTGHQRTIVEQIMPSILRRKALGSILLSISSAPTRRRSAARSWVFPQ